MFTGIIEEVGRVRELQRGAASCALTVDAKEILADIHLGDSIAVNGICLTVTGYDAGGFSVDVMHETISRSSIGGVRAGSAVNLERAMQLGGRFGGHIVSGHIDGTGVVKAIEKDDNAIWYTIRTKPEIMRYIIEKGSIAVDGISLTVARVGSDAFCVSVIPHTAEHTTLAQRDVGDTVNLENDCIGKYVERLCVEKGKTARRETGGLTREFLTKNGF